METGTTERNKGPKGEVLRKSLSQKGEQQNGGQSCQGRGVTV